MLKGKRGLSGIVVTVLIILITILAIIIIYMFIIPWIQKSSKDIEIESFNGNVIINSAVYNKTLAKIEISLKNNGEGKLSHIQIIIDSDSNSLTYNLLDTPERLETKNYLLNISGKINGITAYPISVNGKQGIGARQKTIFEGIINDKLTLIEPSKLSNRCISSWQCSGFSKCTVKYDLNNFLANEMDLSSEQFQNCYDKNNCNSMLIERKICDDKAKVNLKKTTENGRDFVEVYDPDNIMISKLEFKEGEQNILNIELPI